MTDKQRKGLDYLARADEFLYKIDYKDLLIDLNSYIQSVPISGITRDKIFRFDETHPRDYSVIYRARENEQVPFKKIDCISIIPDSKKEKIKFGRCNKELEEIFYASNDLRAACIEALTNGFTHGVQGNRMVTVGHWKIVEPLELAQINYSAKELNYFLQHDKERYEKMIDYARGVEENTLKQIVQNSKGDPDFAKEFLEIISAEFAKTKIEGAYDYFLSNYYCYHVFDNTVIENNQFIDGILYPSVSFAYQEFNLALHPRAMKKLKFLYATKVWIIYSAQKDEFDFHTVESNVKADSEGNLLWKQ